MTPSMPSTSPASAPASTGPGEDRPGEAVRLPTEPYPGLRPFLKHESTLLLGRERQVREVIERLQQTHFVAVIGGSGSGKSSLVLAGVVPELRSFGIPGAGDCWLPMVCTPGTNGARAGTPGRASTPVTRLAWKFAKLLRPAASAQAEVAREAEIADVFRQENGFARLVDTFADELALPAGPSSAKVRLLFVIDQFEELFHPTNEGVGDARLLVERVIDHFFSPHPRCYIVLTMRSEHLNDCASYLELPDAINKASYLVRRLDEAELREAIVGPAQRYLRLLQRRAAPDAPPLPEAVAYEPRVIDRLMLDVNAITHDPDHLPLLQHLLARLWEAALEREGRVGGVPAQIVWADLERAVRVRPAAVPATDMSRTLPGATRLPFDNRTNVLRASLENWAEAVYARRMPAQRSELDAVLRRLAFKDPNTGMYTQQRIDVDDPLLFTDEPRPRERLRALVEDGFIGSVDYLFWDDENPQRTTLKVSHESFIRGWARFRRWADEDDRRFQAYLRLLDDCARWVDAGRIDDALATGETLRRFHDAGLDTALADADASARFARLLAMDRDGHRVAPVAGEALAFMLRSSAHRDRLIAERECALAQHQAERENAEQAQRNALVAQARLRRNKFVGALLVVGVLGAAGVAVAELMLAHKERTLHRSYALAAETQVAFQPQFQGFEAMQAPLLASLMGTRFLDEGVAKPVGPALLPPLSLLYATRLEGLERTELLSQVRNIASLRTVLLGAAWPVAAGGSGGSGASGASATSVASGVSVVSGAAGADVPMAAVPARTCTSARFGNADAQRDPRGARFHARPAPDDERGLVVTESGADGTSVFAGRMARGSTQCLVDALLIATPPPAATGARVAVGLAADLSNLVFFFPDYLQFHAILWGDPKLVQLRQRSVVANPNLAGGVPPDAVSVLASSHSAFATDVRLGAQTLRLFDLEPTPIGDRQARQRGTAALAGAAAGSVCAAFSEAMRIDSASGEQVLASEAGADATPTHCLHVKQGRGNAPGSAAPYLATLYAFRDAGHARDTERQAPLLRDLVLGAVRPTDFRIDAAAGWLAFSDDARHWRAVPWSVPALRALAAPLFVPKTAGASQWAGAGVLRLIVGDQGGGDADLPRWLGAAPAQPRKTNE